MLEHSNKCKNTSALHVDLLDESDWCQPLDTCEHHVPDNSRSGFKWPPWEETATWVNWLLCLRCDWTGQWFKNKILMNSGLTERMVLKFYLLLSDVSHFPTPESLPPLKPLKSSLSSFLARLWCTCGVGWPGPAQLSLAQTSANANEHSEALHPLLLSMTHHSRAPQWCHGYTFLRSMVKMAWPNLPTFTRPKVINVFYAD